ncbi:hypothetical protein HYU11_04645, partial [Candidatus Woesearchaeota archaeon]|nr:hypothetical protein [Candidatus Woesearchaeota archaeon]
DGTVPGFPFTILYRNSSAFSSLSDGSTASCNFSLSPVEATAMGVSSPSCELIITYNYSSTETATFTKTAGFFGAASTGTATDAISSTFSTSNPNSGNDEGIATVKNAYLFAATPSSSISGPLFRQNVTNHTQTEDQTLNFWETDNEHANLLYAIYNTTTNLSKLKTRHNITLQTDTPSPMSAVQWVTYSHTKPSDRLMPTVKLWNPASNTNTTSKNMSFNFTAYDIGGIGNATLLINLTRNNSNYTNIISGQNASINVTDMPEGVFNWSIEACDKAGNCNTSTEIFNLTVDYSGPNSTIVFPGNKTIVEGNTVINASVNDSVTGTRLVEMQLWNITDNVSGWMPMNLSFGDKHTGYWNYTIDTSVFPDGHYNITLNATDFMENSAIYANHSIITIDNPKPDLYINSSEINITANLIEGQTVQINSTLKNLGDDTAYNINVSFYENGILAKNFTIENLSPSLETTLIYNWTAVIGNYNITIETDPPIASNGTTNETNETNNIANFTLFIPAYGVYYGQAILNIHLGTSENGWQIRWLNQTNSSGNIYVTSTATRNSVSWQNLQAIGIAKNGDRATDDWEEMDMMLNMSNLTDSINRTYTVQGDPINITSFNLFSSPIQNVSVANSTNSSNFLTGILWDTTDAETQYNTGDVPDLVFVTSINRNKQGKYGIYDFELKVPANLRTYRNATLDSVEFYLDLI